MGAARAAAETAGRETALEERFPAENVPSRLKKSPTPAAARRLPPGVFMVGTGGGFVSALSPQAPPRPSSLLGDYCLGLHSTSRRTAERGCDRAPPSPADGRPGGRRPRGTVRPEAEGTGNSRLTTAATPKHPVYPQGGTATPPPPSAPSSGANPLAGMEAEALPEYLAAATAARTDTASVACTLPPVRQEEEWGGGSTETGNKPSQKEWAFAGTAVEDMTVAPAGPVLGSGTVTGGVAATATPWAGMRRGRPVNVRASAGAAPASTVERETREDLHGSHGGGAAFLPPPSSSRLPFRPTRPSDVQWLAKFRLLRRHHDQTGSSGRVVVINSDGVRGEVGERTGPLARWVEEQRGKKRSGELEDLRVRALDCLGFNWKNSTWEDVGGGGTPPPPAATAA